MRKGVFLLVITVLLGLTGCVTPAQNQSSGNGWDGDLVRVGYYLADNLASNLSQQIAPNDQLIVASFVNVNNLGQSSTFGRLIAEQVASRFAQKGIKVIELKLRQNSVFIQEGKGEFLLSRDLKEISRTHNASAVVVGTYADGFDRLYVSARIVRPTDNIVIASYDIGVPMGPNQMGILLRDK